MRTEPTGVVDAIAAASRTLTNLLHAEPDAAHATLADLDRRAPLDASDVDALVRWKRLELLRIAARDLTGLDPLERVGEQLAAMAADVLRGAIALTGDAASGLAVIGMGKLGGRELNYASDVDVVFVGGDDHGARAAMDIARRCFRVDADLRPEGRDGPLTRSLASYESYWDRWAQAWEFQALLKARPVAGDVELGRRFAEAAAHRLWERPFTADDLRQVRAMKARVEGEVARKGLVDREIKRGPGGIRDVEFSVQLLQLVHGRLDPGLRSPTTLDALAELSGAGYVDPADAGGLEDAYRFLRTVEHRLQLADEQQVHAVPADVASRTRLAKVLGYADDPDASAVERFDADLRHHQATARAIHERLYFRPLLEAFAGTSDRLTPQALEQRLRAFGFTDVERTRQAMAELTHGLTRSSRLMQQLLPLLLGWLSESPDPDLGLLGLRNLASGPQRTTELVTAFRESPEVARRVCRLLGTSRLVAETLTRNPDLVPDLGDPAKLAPRGRAELVDAIAATIGWRTDDAERAKAVRRLQRREAALVVTRDVLGEDAVEDTEAALTQLAEAVVEASVRALGPTIPFAVIAMGRFGGGELSYASDLDVLFVYDGTSADDFAAAERIAERVLRFLNGTTPAVRIYEIDADLRPEGKQGPLARSLDGYRTYYERWAQTWERQALTRARAIAGDPAVGRRFLETVEPFVWRAPVGPDVVREIRRMKARVERERIPAGEDPQFHLKLGRGGLADVEWTVQLLELVHGVRQPGTMAGLEQLRRAGALTDADASTLAAAYRYCERTRNRLFLVRGAPGDALPTDTEQLTRLARSLETSAGELREQHRRVTRRARSVVERVFYGKAP